MARWVVAVAARCEDAFGSGQPLLFVPLSGVSGCVGVARMSGANIGSLPPSARLHLSDVQGPLIVGIAYYLGAEAAFLVGTLTDKIFAPFWPPNAILFCALALVPYRRWPHYVIAVVPAHIIAELERRHGLVTDVRRLCDEQYGCADEAHSVCVTCWVRRRGSTVYKGRLATCSSLRSSVPALRRWAARLCASLVVASSGNYWQFWAEWYVANALASLTLGAMVLTWLSNDTTGRNSAPVREQIEASLLLAGLGVACAIAFRVHPFANPCYIPSLLYLPLPFVVWAAVRFQSIGASAAIFVMTVGSIASTLHGSTVFAGADVEANVLALQLFLVVVSVSTLLLGASTDELRRAERTTARLARFVLGAQDDERRQIAKRLLDDISQRLAAATWVTNQQSAPAGLEQAVQKIDTRSQRTLLPAASSDARGSRFGGGPSRALG